jgi:hypothetical protein
VLGAFLAQDLALFVGFFDLMLIPFYLLTGIYGGPGRVARDDQARDLHAGRLAADARRRRRAGGAASQHSGQPLNFTYSALRAARLGGGTQDWIFLLFAAAFLVKMPAFPLHGWMPDGYRAMPIEVLAIFSGVLSKVGAYGFLAIVLPIMPQASVALPDAAAADRPGLDPLRLGDGLHADQRPPDRRLLLGRPARLHHDGDLRAGAAGRAGRGPADGQPRHRRRPAVHHRRAARRARRRLGGHPRHGRHRDARADPRDAVF